MPLSKVNRPGLNTGVTDNSDATAITIDSSENCGFGTTSPSYRVHSVAGAGSGIAGYFHNSAGSGNGTALLARGGANNSGAGAFIVQDYNGNEDFKVDGLGRVTTPNQPRFRVRNSGVTNYTSNGAISFNTEDFDVGNNYSGSTFTCPVDGLYFFSFNLFANTGHSANVDLLHNGGFIGRAERGSTTGGYESIGFSLIFECSANDAVRLQLNSGQVHTNSALNFFTGYLIG